MPRKRKEVQEEESGITRCVCGQENLPNYAARIRGVDPSLFIQCDHCEVWQHGYCVGLAAKDVPDVYFCEECRPEFHEVKTRNGRTTSKYVPQPSQTSDSDAEPEPRDRRKRRQTMNSREDDILQRVLEQSAREAEALKRRSAARAAGIEDPSSEEEQSTGVEEDEIKTEAKDDSDGKASKEESDGASEEGAKSQTPSKESNEVKDEPSASAGQEEEPEVEPEPEVEEVPVIKAKRRRGRPGPKPKNANNNGSLPNGNKKCKPKIPSPRITFNEMQKRVAIILEFSGHTQTEMMAEESLRLEMLEEQRKRENNQPVITQLEELCNQHKKNLGQLEGLTAKLLEWQEKYG